MLDFGKVFWHSHSKYSNLRKNMTSMNIEILEAVSEKLEVRFGCNKKIILSTMRRYESYRMIQPAVHVIVLHFMVHLEQRNFSNYR